MKLDETNANLSNYNLWIYRNVRTPPLSGPLDLSQVMATPIGPDYTDYNVASAAPQVASRQFAGSAVTQGMT